MVRRLSAALQRATGDRDPLAVVRRVARRLGATPSRLVRDSRATLDVTAARDRVALAVAGISVAALVARLAGLGVRVAHYDEGWVGYWILRYVDTGAWEYRPLMHGPFLVHVNRWNFALLGANDFTARLPVAVLGALLPLTALLLRRRLRDGEVVALAALLAANPLLLYYSRFMRFDLPLAAFGLATVAFAVAALDTGRRRYVYAAAVAFALALTTKENVLLYPVAWAGATALLVHDRAVADRLPDWLVAARGTATDGGDHDDSGTGTDPHETGPVGEMLGERAASGRAAVTDRAVTAAVALALALAVLVFFYAPRAGAGTGEPGLWAAFGDPTLAPAVLAEATVGSARKAIRFWAGDMQRHPYLPYLGDYLATLGAGAAAVCLFAVVGFVADRYWGPRRDLVAFAFYWGGLAVVGFPLANFLPTPWSTLHAVAPLTIPAAVGVAYVVRVGLGALGGPDRDRVVAAAAALVLVVAALQVGVVGARTSYLDLQNGDRSPGGGSQMIYLSQALDRAKPTLHGVETAVAGHDDGPDVMYYGPYFAIRDESVADRPPACCGWHQRLSLPWYMELYGAETASTSDPTELAAERPPVVVAHAKHRQALAARLDGYVVVVRDLTQINKRTVVLVDESRLSPDAPIRSAPFDPPPQTGQAGSINATE